MPRYWKTTVTVTVISTGDHPVCFDDIDGLSYLITTPTFAQGRSTGGSAKRSTTTPPVDSWRSKAWTRASSTSAPRGGDEDDGQEDE